MNTEPDHPLHGIEPILRALDKPLPVTPSAWTQEAFMKAVAEKRSTLAEQTILNSRQMEAVILQLLSQQGMEGLELMDTLNSRKLTYETPGEGTIYGHLHRLESQGWIESRWRESSARMVKTYHLTEKGGSKLQESALVLAPFQALLAAE